MEFTNEGIDPPSSARCGCGEVFVPSIPLSGIYFPGDMRPVLCPNRCYPAWEAQRDDRYAMARELNEMTCEREGHQFGDFAKTHCNRCRWTEDGKPHVMSAARPSMAR